jgi:hypothetical protein
MSLCVLCLQDIGLDTAFLPSLTELVSTARMAKIPEQGPGAITSLCLLDQAVSSREHLACLSQLSSLAGRFMGLSGFRVHQAQSWASSLRTAWLLQQLCSGRTRSCRKCGEGILAVRPQGPSLADPVATGCQQQGAPGMPLPAQQSGRCVEQAWIKGGYTMQGCRLVGSAVAAAAVAR